MTTDEWEEYSVCYQTRLGILCGNADPTWDQIEMAKKEADELIERMRQ